MEISVETPVSASKGQAGGHFTLFDKANGSVSREYGAPAWAPHYQNLSAHANDPGRSPGEGSRSPSRCRVMTGTPAKFPYRRPC